MTELTITPKVADKTARFKGTVAAGEHVSVTIKGGAEWLGDDNGANLMLRVLDLVTGRTLAVFPRPSETVSEPSASADAEPDSWTTAGDDNADLFCELNLNTTRMVAAARHMLRVPVLFVLGDTDAPRTLYFRDRYEIEYWPERIGDDTPYDLDKWPKQIDEWTELVAGFGETLTEHIGDEVKHVTASERATWNRKYVKPVGGIPANDLSNGLQSVLAAVPGKADKATTYTKAEVDSLVSGSASGVFVIVDSLPATGEANKIYLVPNGSGAAGNVRDEYMWVNGAWELIGSTQVDLSNYYDKTAADGRFVQKETGKGLVAVDSALSQTSENPVQNKVVAAALNGKREMDDLAYCADDWFVTGGTISRLLLRKVADGQWAGTQDGVQWGLMRIAGEWYFGKTADTSYGGRSDASADATSLSIDIGGTAYLLTKGDRLALVSEIDEIDISGKANKSEMLVTPGTGADADKTTIQLKNGTSATVLTAHQDVSGKASLSDLPYRFVTPGEDWSYSGVIEGLAITGSLVYDDVDGAYTVQATWQGGAVEGYSGSSHSGDELSVSLTFDLLGMDSETIVTATRPSSLPGHLIDRAVNKVVPKVEESITNVWADGEVGTPVYANGFWNVDFGDETGFDYDGPVAGSDYDEEITFIETSTMSFTYKRYDDMDYMLVFSVGGDASSEVSAMLSWDDEAECDVVRRIEYDGIEYELQSPVSSDSEVGTVVIGTAVVAEHVVTRTTTYGPQVTLVMPPAVPGRARDLLVRIDLSQAAGVPPVSFSGGTFETADGKMPELVQGVNLLSFTETEAGVFGVAHKEMKQVQTGGS